MSGRAFAEPIFTAVIRKSRRIENGFTEKMKDVSEGALNYLGIAICGVKKKVNKLTGSMALLR